MGLCGKGIYIEGAVSHQGPLPGRFQRGVWIRFCKNRTDKFGGKESEAQSEG